MKLGQNDMTDEFLQQMAGNTPVNATPNKGSITRDRLTQGVIGEGQTDFITRGKNLYDKDNLTAGYAINARGELFSSSSYYVTDFINILPNTTYHADNNNVILALYDSSFSFISRPLNNAAGAFTTPENSMYARIAIFEGARNNLQFEQGEKATTREDYSISIDKLKLKENNFQDRIIETESLKSLETGKNLFDISTANEVGLIGMVNGIVDSSQSNFSVSPYIEIDSNANYSKSHIANFAFFDAEKTPITIELGTGEGQYSSSMETFTPPANAHFIRTSVRGDSIETFQIEQSASPTEFEPYGYRVKEFLYNNDIASLKEQVKNLELVESKSLKYPSPGIVDPEISLIGGTARSVAFVDNEDNLWAIQWDNRIYKNPVNTSAWQMVLDAGPSLQSGETISGYALVVSDTGRIVVGTNHGRVLVSDTSKTTLTEAFAFKGGYTQNTWGFDKQGQYILMGSYLVNKNAENPGREVYLSKDHGETWELIFDMPISDMADPSDYHIHDVAFDPYSGAILVVQGDTVNNQIYYSYDFGGTWETVNPEGTTKIHPTSILCFPEGIAFGSDELPEGISWWDRPTDETEPAIKHDDIYWKKKFNLGETIIGNIAVKGATLFDESGMYGVIGFINHNTSAPGYPRLFATGDGGRSWHQIWKSDNQTDENGFFNTLLRKTESGIEIYSRYSIGGQPHLFKVNMPIFISG